MSYVMSMNVSDVAKLIEFAREKSQEERMWQLYLVVLPRMKEFQSYEKWLETYKLEVKRRKEISRHQADSLFKDKHEIIQELRGGSQ